MSAHSISLDDLPRDGERLDLAKVSKLNGALLVTGLLGLAVSACYFLGFFGEQKQQEFAYSWLFAFFFYFTLTNGGIFWVMLQHISNSGWSVAVRRVFENLSGNIKWMLVFALPFICIPKVQNSLWEWMAIHRTAATLNVDVVKGLETIVEGDAAKGVAADPHVHLLVAKFGYLNITSWTVRAFLYFAFLMGVTYLLRSWSIKQDTDGDFKHTFRMRALCAFPLLIYALAVTFSAVDWVMALDYSWFSTMWGVYIFAGGAWSSMALTIIALNYIKANGYLKKIVSPEHYHLMGKLLFAFTVFWAYVAFSQFFLIWYANITEETRFFVLRNTGGWWYFSHILVWCHFVVTFVLLLSAGRKKQTGSMNWLCLWVLAMHFIDIYWLIIPERGPSLTHGEFFWCAGSGWGDFFAFIGIGGVVGWAYLRRLAKASLYPCRDPRLLESVTAVN